GEGIAWLPVWHVGCSTAQDAEGGATMMDPLATYLTAHRAGATGAIELLEALKRREEDPETRRLAADILARVREDVEVLDRLVETVGERSALKEAGGWIAQKVAHLKMPGHGDHPLGVFQSLEAVALGILGKRALWEALGRIAGSEPRVAGVDYEALSRRAAEQFDLVNRRRLELATAALLRDAHREVGSARREEAGKIPPR